MSTLQRRSDGTVVVNYDDGAHYEGRYSDGQPNGRGKMIYSSEKEYDGFFTNGYWNGWGSATFILDSGIKEVDSGYWNFNKRDGTFESDFYVSASGYRYCHRIADYKSDVMHGKCTEKFYSTDGETWVYDNVYTYTNGERNGYYRFADSAGNVIESEYLHDEFQKKCIAHYCDTYPKVYLRNAVYEGDIILNDNGSFIRHGTGKYTTPDGSVYEGSFIDSKRNGTFKVTYPNGKTDIQEYRQDSLVNTLNTTTVIHEEDYQVSGDYLSVSFEDNTQYSEELQPFFKGVVGMHEVKKQLDTMYKRFRLDAMRQKALGISNSAQGYYFIITGNPGTGKTTVARIIGKMLYNMAILPKDVFVEVDRSKLVAQYIGQTAVMTSEVIESARGGTLFIDEAYTLYKKDNEKDFGTEAIDTLLKDMEDHRGDYCVIMAGYADRMNDMIRNANQGLASRFDHKIEIGDYTSDELVDILVLMATSRKFRIKKEAREIILNRINREKVDDTFDNARFARRLLDEAIEHQAIRLSENFENLDMNALQVLEAEDFGNLETDVSSLPQVMEKLNRLIGLDSVKKEVNSLVNAIRIQNESRKRGLQIANNQIPLNMVFTGNPGTGKTTVARLLGQIYYNLGLLKRGDVFVECVRADLIGRYQGETAIKVKEVVKKALGGVLFIDEAYSLVNGNNDSFGLEAVNTLVSEIENNRDNLSVILAGYTKEMEEFLDSNSGLRSRLSKVIEFPDYTLDELVQIFRSDMTHRGYMLEYSEEMIRSLMEKEMQKRDFGNARGVRNLADRVIAKHNERINGMDFSQLKNEDFVTVKDEDLTI